MAFLHFACCFYPDASLALWKAFDQQPHNYEWNRDSTDCHRHFPVPSRILPLVMTLRVQIIPWDTCNIWCSRKNCKRVSHILVHYLNPDWCFMTWRCSLCLMDFVCPLVQESGRQQLWVGNFGAKYTQQMLGLAVRHCALDGGPKPPLPPFAGAVPMDIDVTQHSVVIRQGKVLLYQKPHKWSAAEQSSEIFLGHFWFCVNCSWASSCTCRRQLLSLLPKWF